MIKLQWFFILSQSITCGPEGLVEQHATCTIAARTFTPIKDAFYVSTIHVGSRVDGQSIYWQAYYKETNGRLVSVKSILDIDEETYHDLEQFLTPIQSELPALEGCTGNKVKQFINKYSVYISDKSEGCTKYEMLMTAESVCMFWKRLLADSPDDLSGKVLAFKNSVMEIVDMRLKAMNEAIEISKQDFLVSLSNL